MIKNKNVIFVGGCPNLIGQNYGEWIDSHDIVIRSNGGYPVQDKLKVDYGSKCDIWTINNQYNRYKNRHGIDYPVKKLYKSDLMDIFKELDYIPGLLMGPAVWTWVLRQKPEMFSVVGVDFMLSKSTSYKPFDYPEYYDGYLPKEIQIEGNKVKEKDCNGHNLYHNNRYIVKLFTMYDNFVTDGKDYKNLVRYVNGGSDD